MEELEDMNSKEFKDAVQEENRRWTAVLEPLTSSVESWKQSMADLQATAYPEVPTFAPISFSWQGRTVRKQAGSTGYSVNLWIGKWTRMGLAGAGFGSGPYFYTIEDIGEGAEVYELTIWHCTVRSKKPKKIWSRNPVGPTIAIQGNTVYYCGVENKLRYPDVWRTDIATGKKTVCIFEEPDKRFQVSVVERSGTVFVHTANALHQRLAIIDPTGISWIVEKESTILPLSPSAWATNTEFVLDGRTIPYPFGYFLEDGIHVGSDVLFVLVKEGQDSLWHWSLKGGWTPLIQPPQGLITHMQIFHEPTQFPRLLFRAPMIADSVWEYRDSKLYKVLSFPEPVRLPYFQGGTVPFGNIQIPYTWVSATPNPRGLLVEAYGAYGISARRAYPLRWLAYLAAGWAFAYVCPRGGREGGDAWYNGGRTALRKHHTFLDTEWAIRHIQEEVGIGPERTVFFGRSAGGWLAARLAQDCGRDLVAAVYTEVPYVDVLSTTGNPSLPLTQLEYDEFGDPRRPAERAALRHLSPVDTVRACKRRCPTMVIRTALHDSQVYPYESLKWAKKLRSAGWTNVYVGIDGNGGHFAAADAMIQQRAEDAAILDAAIGSRVYHPSRITSLHIHNTPYIRSLSRSRKTRRTKSTKVSDRIGRSGRRTKRSR